MGEAPSAGWGRTKAKADAPSRSAPHFPCLRSRTCPPKTAPLPAYGRITVRKGGSAQGNPAPARAFSPRQPAYGRAPARLCPNHCAQRRSAQGNPRSCPCVLPAPACLRPSPYRLCAESLCAMAECTRQSPPLSVRTPRVSPPKTEPPPADGRSAERRVGEGEGKGGRPLAQQPAPVCLPPRPRRLNGSPASAGGRENDRMAHRRTATPTHRTPRGNDTCTIRVPRRKGAQSVVHNL